MTKAEEILKQLELNYKPVIKDVAWVITPMDFMCKIKIVLISDLPNDYSMFIFNEKTNEIEHEKKFKEVGNITDIYSYLYNYDNKNLKNKKNGTR